jgi:predicted SAM-dependent methyltransferase
MSSQNLKIHLGCGTVYLPGYVNIDYPPDQQTSQHFPGDGQHPDQYADITTLHYKGGSIEEVRLHHVFEHFDRATALRLLVEWYDWLCDGGKLTIETPDFDRCIKAYLFGNAKTRGKALRHLFGSHDAHWAVHYDGWYQAKFKKYLSALGFRNLKFSFTKWRGTYNIIVHAQKTAPFTSIAERKKAAKALLRLSLVDDSLTEQNVFSIWMSSFEKSLE